jgi:WD40 repeat protein/serine/threonine protein kinase
MNERDIFYAATEIADPAQRLAYLDKVCAGNPSLKQDVEGMLQVYPHLGKFLEFPAMVLECVSGPPARAGRFQLGQELARGGMGVVYRARDESLGRNVAVKVLHERYLVDSLVGQRFLDEARITAQLQHPCIPPVFEVGRLTDERPYLAMKLIKGRTLEDLLQERPEPASDRGRILAVFHQICQAVGYAHSKHILHRDLKPANIMVGAFGEVQVMDWGLAKLLPPAGATDQPLAAGTEISDGTVIQTSRENDSSTLAGSMLGTPAFMAPEQASGELNRLDERTDVFGLGAILCVILTGKPPYASESTDELRLMAARGALAPAQARLDGCGADANLVALCRQCLSAEREARPRDAGAVAATVQAYLASVEERARQAQLEHAAALARAAEQRKRRRVQLILAATVLVALVAGLAATTWQALRATQAESDTRLEADHNRALLYSADTLEASQAWQSDDASVAQCKDLLLAHVPEPGQPDLREFAWRYQWRLLHRDSGVSLPVVPRAASVADDGRVLTLDETGRVNTWLIGDRTARQELTLDDGGLLGVTLSGNGEVAAVIDRNGSPKVLDTRTGLQKMPIRAPSALVNVKLSANGRFLAGVGRDKHARVWEVASGEELYDYRMIDPTVRNIDLSLDGKQLLASWGDLRTMVVLYRAGQEKPSVLNNQEKQLKGAFNRLRGVLSPDGKLAVVALGGNFLEMYDTTTEKRLGYLPSRSMPVCVAFSPDGDRLAAGETTGLVTVWRLTRPVLPENQPEASLAPAPMEAGQPSARAFKGHQAAIEALAFAADGRKLVSISHDHTARCWDMDDHEEARVLEKGRSQIDGLSYAPNGRHLALASMDDGIRIYDVMSTGSPRSLTTRPSRRAVFSPDGRTIAGAPDHHVTLWDTQTGDLLCTLGESEPHEIGAIAFSPDGRWLAVGVGGPNTFATDKPEKVEIFDIVARKECRTFAAPTQVSAVAFSADGQVMAAAGHDGTIWLWGVPNWNEIVRWQAPAGTRYASILFLAGGQELAVGAVSGAIDFWDVRTRTQTRQIHGHIGCVSAMALSPDGRTLATASWDHSIKLFDSATGRELRTLYREDRWMYALAFSPDGNTLASGGLSMVLRIWEASSKETVAAEMADRDRTAKTSQPQ